MLYRNRTDHSGLNGGCTAIWKASVKTSTLLLFLDSLFPKTETYARLLDDLKERRKYRISKEEAVDDTLEIRFGRGYGPIARHST
jgi:hypothetical protein